MQPESRQNHIEVIVRERQVTGVPLHKRYSPKSIGRGPPAAHSEHLRRKVERVQVRAWMRTSDHPGEVSRAGTDLENSPRVVRHKVHQPPMRATRQAWIRQFQDGTGD